MTRDKESEARRKRLRRLLGDAAQVEIATDDLRWLCDEVSRLQQANDRLRRQNRKLRLQRERIDGAPVDGAAPDDDHDDAQ